MSITVRRAKDGAYEVTSGATRLRARLETGNPVAVSDLATGDTLYVHEVAGWLVIVSADGQANVEDAALAAVNRARGKCGATNG